MKSEIVVAHTFPTNTQV
uniref:Uncharacterized protein n=1 Tax=Arundo donax TaxID=35708 RepID=A0A0A9BP19_ARUDO